MFHVPIQQHLVNCRAGTTSLFVMFKTGGRGAQADSTSEDLPTNDTRSPIGHRISRATTHAARFWRVTHRRRTPRVPFRLHSTHHRPVHSSIFISPKFNTFFSQSDKGRYYFIVCFMYNNNRYGAAFDVLMIATCCPPIEPRCSLDACRRARRALQFVVK
jgi:hypothetical protein